VQIIPYTWAETNLHTREAGQAVNLECDILGKYVTRALELTGPGAKTGPQ
jgi:riboflavin synthase